MTNQKVSLQKNWMFNVVSARDETGDVELNPYIDVPPPVTLYVVVPDKKRLNKIILPGVVDGLGRFIVRVEMFMR